MFANLRKNWVLIVLIALCILARSHKISSPLIEYHSWRQADTAAVARNFARDGFDLLHPTYDDFTSLQSGLDNPHGYRMVEFPLYNAFIAFAYKLLPSIPTIVWGTILLDITMWGRILSIVSSCITLWSLFHLARRAVHTQAAFWTGLIWAIAPFTAYYTRTILPENPGIACTLFACHIASFYTSRRAYVVSAVILAAALLIKPTFLFFVPLWLICQFDREQSIKRWKIHVLTLILVIIPLIFWRWHITQYPEGIPISKWLLTHTNTPEGMQNIFLRPAFFRWILYERIALLILGVFMLPFFVRGLTYIQKSWLPVTLLLCSMLYVLTFQGGNVQHEYYQILILPALSLYTGIGVADTISHNSVTRRIYSSILVLMFFLLSYMISWDKVRHYYYSISDIPQFSKAIANFVKPDDLLVTDTGGDTTVLYAFDRKGAPALFADPPVMRAKGYKYIFTYNHETATNLQKNFGLEKPLISNDRFILLKL